MLTATYSLVALSVEQDSAHCSLSALQQSIRRTIASRRINDPCELKTAVERLSRFDQYCHERKVEMYVIPAVRRATREADPLLAELDSLDAQGMKILRSVRDGVRSMLEQGAANVEEIRHAMEQYCSNLYKRLRKEEELFRIARRVISGDEWFALASCFLSHDARIAGRKRGPQAVH